MYGLSDADINYMKSSFLKYKNIESVILFGSRALGNYRASSDVDIAILGRDLDRKDLLGLSYELNEESPIPFDFDVLDYAGIKNKELKKHIDEFGKIIYEALSK